MFQRIQFLLNLFNCQSYTILWSFQEYPSESCDLFKNIPKSYYLIQNLKTPSIIQYWALQEMKSKDFKDNTWNSLFMPVHAECVT